MKTLFTWPMEGRWNVPASIMLVLLVTLGNQCKSENAMENEVQAATQMLHIALQDGFEGEPVVVHVNGEEVYRREDVQTDYRISLAVSFEVPLPDGTVTVEVGLPNRQMTDSVEMDGATTPHVGVSYLDGELRFRLSEGPFGYM